MPDSLITELLNLGGLGCFAAFLVWQHLKNQQRMDKLVDGFQSQLKEIDAGYEKRIEIMRERYDLVIETHRERCASEKEALQAQRDKLQEQLQEQLISTRS